MIVLVYILPNLQNDLLMNIGFLIRESVWMNDLNEFPLCFGKSVVDQLIFGN